MTRRVVTAAGMAPSLFNTQPWKFRLRPDRIEVHADLGRRSIATDPEDRELRIACGAALFNLRLAVHAQGVTPVVCLAPGDAPAALAVIRRGAPSEQHLDDAPCTGPSGDGTPTGSRSWTHRSRRPTAVCWPTRPSPRGRDLHMVTAPTERSELRCIIAAADRQQRGNVVCRAELEAWAGYLRSRPDGVPLAASGPAPEPQDRWGIS